MHGQRFRHWKNNACEAVRATAVHAKSPWHDHAHLVLGLVDRGRLVLWLRSGPQDIAAGEGFAIAPHVAHRLVTKGPADYRILCLPGESVVAGTVRSLCWKPLFHRMFLFAVAGGVPSVAPLLALSRRGGKSPLAARLIPEAVLVVRSRLAAAVASTQSLRALSQYAGLSAFHLQHLYVQTTGLSPRQSQIGDRLRLGRRLILAGVSLSEAALASGFSDQSHFTRFFKRAMGVSPGEYLRQIHAFR